MEEVDKPGLKVLRFAPAPSGRLHLGHLWILFVNNRLLGPGDKIFLRVDNTRSEPSERINSFLRELFSICRAFKYSFNGIFLQGSRNPIYRDYVSNISGTYRRDGLWCLDVDSELSFHDSLRGRTISKRVRRQPWILTRTGGQVLYHLSSVVDDIEMGVTDIVRASDHVDNSLLQNLLFRGFNHDVRFWHCPLIYDEEGLKISKRKGNYMDIFRIIDGGILPLAIERYFEHQFNSFDRKSVRPFRFDRNILLKFNSEAIRSDPVKSMVDWLDVKALGGTREAVRMEWISNSGQLISRFNNLRDSLDCILDLLPRLESVLRDYRLGLFNRDWMDILAFVLEYRSDGNVVYVNNLPKKYKIYFRGDILKVESSPSIDILFDILYRLHHGRP